MPMKLEKLTEIAPKGNRGDRVRNWLVTNYEDDTWILKDSFKISEFTTVTFRIVMPDGKLLTEHSKLYSTVKEFAYWIRAGDYSRIDDAKTHATYVNTIIRISMAVFNLGYTSFSDLQKADVDSICQASAGGAGAVLNVPERIGNYLAKYATWADVPANEKIERRRHNEQNVLVENIQFNRTGVLKACNFPSTVAIADVKRELDTARVRLNGQPFVVNDKQSSDTLTSIGLMFIMRSFEGLYRLRHHMESECLTFMPFEEGAGLKAASLGRETEPTPIVPNDLMMKMLEEALRFLSDRSEEIVENHQNATARGLLRDGYDHVLAIEARQQASKLISACYIIIAAFTARRSGEITLMKADCFYGNNNDGWFLHVYIEKSTREMAWIPVPRVVVFAVNTIRRLSKPSEKTDDSLLFRYFDPVRGKEVGARPDKHLNRFAEFVGATNYTDHENNQDVWHWTTRQFRRFYAVLFFFRYRGKKESIAHHLRHFSMETSSGYLRLDPVVDRLWIQEMQNFKRQTVRDIVSGELKVTGPMGEVINAEISRLRTVFDKAVKIYPARLADMVLKRLDDNNVIFTPKAWATCSCPNTKSGARRAACQRASPKGVTGLGPNFAEAGPSICPGCPWAIIDEENLIYMDQEIQELRESNDAADRPSIFAELQEEKLVVLRSQRSKLTVTAARM